MRISAVVIVLFAGLFVASAATADDWVSYTSPDHAYSARFPTQPTLSDNGKTVTSIPVKHFVYALQFADIDGLDEGKADKVFAAVDQSLTEGGVILSLRNFKFVGHPAQDVKVRKNGLVIWDRIIVVHSRLYQILHGTDRKDTVRPDRFWNSFKLRP